MGEEVQFREITGRNRHLPGVRISVKTEKISFQKTASYGEIIDYSVTFLYCLTVVIYDALTTSHWWHHGRR
jgi:hypothetical protein